MVERSTMPFVLFCSWVRTRVVSTFSHAREQFSKPENNFCGVVGMSCAWYFFPVAIFGPSTFHYPVLTEFFHYRFSRYPTEVVI